ncbi:hypothetical protein LG324_04455 [Phycicoccus jejuensis]|jgi:hypothetical protein|uniref:hypothetical protein n=1 Tax=Phycicoccus jejuensis TaxID=367299 RepID=UPI00384BAC2C
MPEAHGSAVQEYRRHRRLVLAGKVLMGVAAVVAIVHVGAHLTSSPSGLVDLVAGYPAAGAVFVIGAVLAGRAEPGTRR